jgi:hypothetical protein
MTMIERTNRRWTTCEKERSKANDKQQTLVQEKRIETKMMQVTVCLAASCEVNQDNDKTC